MALGVVQRYGGSHVGQAEFVEHDDVWAGAQRLFELLHGFDFHVDFDFARTGGAPGCWQHITRDLWPAPELVMDTGNSIAPYNHLDTGSPYAIEYVWGRQVGDNTINP